MQSTGRGAAKLGGQGAGWCGGHLHEAERREMARRDDHAEGQEQEGAKDQPLHYLLKLPLPLAVRLGRSRWRAGRVLLVESVVAGIGVGSRLRLRRLPVAQRGRHWNEGDEGTRAAGGRPQGIFHHLTLVRQHVVDAPNHLRKVRRRTRLAEDLHHCCKRQGNAIGHLLLGPLDMRRTANDGPYHHHRK